MSIKRCWIQYYVSSLILFSVIQRGANIALGKPVNISSVHPRQVSYDHEAEHAVDGHRYGGRMVVATYHHEDAPKSWFMVNLQETVHIKIILLIARNPSFSK